MAFRSLVTPYPAVDSPQIPPDPFLPTTPIPNNECDPGSDEKGDEDPLRTLNIYTVAYGTLFGFLCLCLLTCCCLR